MFGIVYKVYKNSNCATITFMYYIKVTFLKINCSTGKLDVCSTFCWLYKFIVIDKYHILYFYKITLYIERQIPTLIFDIKTNLFSLAVISSLPNFSAAQVSMTWNTNTFDTLYYSFDVMSNTDTCSLSLIHLLSALTI